MMEAFAEQQGSLVFITGGLGPTTDDFMRERQERYQVEGLFHSTRRV